MEHNRAQIDLQNRLCFKHALALREHVAQLEACYTTKLKVASEDHQADLRLKLASKDIDSSWQRCATRSQDQGRRTFIFRYPVDPMPHRTDLHTLNNILYYSSFFWQKRSSRNKKDFASNTQSPSSNMSLKSKRPTQSNSSSLAKADLLLTTLHALVLFLSFFCINTGCR